MTTHTPNLSWRGFFRKTTGRAVYLYLYLHPASHLIPVPGCWWSGGSIHFTRYIRNDSVFRDPYGGKVVPLLWWRTLCIHIFNLCNTREQIIYPLTDLLPTYDTLILSMPNEGTILFLRTRRYQQFAAKRTEKPTAPAGRMRKFYSSPSSSSCSDSPVSVIA